MVKQSAKTSTESAFRIEPARLENPPEKVNDAVADLSVTTAVLGRALHPKTASNLADMVRIMNTYYSNLIEGHNTRPRDIVRALAQQFEQDEARRNLQLEAAAHVRVQAEIDRLFAEGQLPEPASSKFLCWVHREFYQGVPEEMLRIHGNKTVFRMEPGQWRTGSEQDVAVGRHAPPSSDRLDEFMRHFESRYSLSSMGRSAKILAMAAAHHRFNYIHPFPDGNGRVSRLMSHAMALKSGIGAHGLWSVSRGLARGLKSRREYKGMMDYADTPRQNDLDGRGNLSQQALTEFVQWFLDICVDQVTFMSDLFDLDNLKNRLHRYVAMSETLKPEAARLLDEALVRGQFERGEIARITGLPERSARRVLKDVEQEGLLASDTPKGSVYLQFPDAAMETLLPRLYPDM